MMFNSIFGEGPKVLTTNEDLVVIFKKNLMIFIMKTVSETYYENLIYDLREHRPEDILTANEVAERSKLKEKLP